MDGNEGGVSSKAAREDNVATRLPEEVDADGLLDVDADADEEAMVPVTELAAFPSDC